VPPALVVNRVFDAPGLDVFQHACKLGCEGIVSKRRGSRYVAGRTEYWLKVKNPDAPAMRREREGQALGAALMRPKERVVLRYRHPRR
jgi:ATP-dependent DNA ligase